MIFKILIWFYVDIYIFLHLKSIEKFDTMFKIKNFQVLHTPDIYSTFPISYNNGPFICKVYWIFFFLHVDD